MLERGQREGAESGHPSGQFGLASVRNPCKHATGAANYRLERTMMAKRGVVERVSIP